MEVTQRLFPNDQVDLIAKIPTAAALSLAQLNKAMVSTDGAAAARVYRRMYWKEVRKAARALGIPESEIQVFAGNCMQRTRNIWFGAVIKALGPCLNGMLKQDLSEIPAIYRVSTDPISLLRALEKEFSCRSANYAKGDGNLYDNYLHK